MTMIERIVAVLDLARRRDGWMDDEDIAAAILMEMREPTPDMITAAVLAPAPTPNTPMNRYHAAWRAIIDHLLGDDGKPAASVSDIEHV